MRRALEATGLFALLVAGAACAHVEVPRATCETGAQLLSLQPDPLVAPVEVTDVCQVDLGGLAWLDAPALPTSVSAVDGSGAWHRALELVDHGTCDGGDAEFESTGRGALGSGSVCFDADADEWRISEALADATGAIIARRERAFGANGETRDRVSIGGHAVATGDQRSGEARALLPPTSEGEGYRDVPLRDPGPPDFCVAEQTQPQSFSIRCGPPEATTHADVRVGRRRVVALLTHADGTEGRVVIRLRRGRVVRQFQELDGVRVATWRFGYGERGGGS